MATKTFSSRADEGKLAFAERLARREYGLSFGQYCGTVLLDSIEKSGRMPDLEPADAAESRKGKAIDFIRAFSEQPHDAAIGRLSDTAVRDLIARRYA